MFQIFIMAEKHLIKISAIMCFFKDEQKLVSKGENAVESGHVKSMVFDADLRLLKGVVHASMRDREYNVEVNFCFVITVQIINTYIYHQP